MTYFLVHYQKSCFLEIKTQKRCGAHIKVAEALRQFTNFKKNIIFFYHINNFLDRKHDFSKDIPLRKLAENDVFFDQNSAVRAMELIFAQ